MSCEGLTIEIDTAGAVEALAGSILDPRRTTPIVGLTSLQGRTTPAMDPRQVRGLLEGEFILVFVPTGPRTRQLTELLPPRMGAYGGCARIWWPGASATSRLSDHPLIYDRSLEYGESALANLLNAWHRGRERRTTERVLRGDVPAQIGHEPPQQQSAERALTMLAATDASAPEERAAGPALWGLRPAGAEGVETNGGAGGEGEIGEPVDQAGAV